jgi:hypothetical protein
MGKVIKTRSDLRSMVADQVEHYDMSCYRLPFDELVDAMTKNLYDFLVLRNFEYGLEMISMSDAAWTRLASPYEKEGE